MDFLVVLGIWMGGAACVIGILQWMKGLMPKLPSQFFSVLVPFISLGIAISIGGLNWIYNVFGIWAVSQIGYEKIIQTIQGKKEP